MQQGKEPSPADRRRSLTRAIRRAQFRPLGATIWAIPAGGIPAASAGPEPESTSRAELCLLNTAARRAKIDITIYYEEEDPHGPYRITVEARRSRRVRFNDLIDPQAIPLGVPFAAVVESNVPIVVQLVHVDTSHGERAMFSSLGFPVEE